jgi:hypothetical protein
MTKISVAHLTELDQILGEEAPEQEARHDIYQTMDEPDDMEEDKEEVAEGREKDSEEDQQPEMLQTLDPAPRQAPPVFQVSPVAAKPFGVGPKARERDSPYGRSGPALMAERKSIATSDFQVAPTKALV